MSVPLPIQRVLEESVSIAAILLAWLVLSVLAFADGRVRSAIQLAGLTMAVLYAVVPGVALAIDADPAYDDPDTPTVLAENGRAMLAGAPWFALALAVAVLAPFGIGLRTVLPGDVRLVAVALESLVPVFAVTGAVTVLLVAVATGTRALRSVRTL